MLFLCVFIIFSIYGDVVWWRLGSSITVSKEYFVFDRVSFYLSLLTIFLSILLVYRFNNLSFRCVRLVRLRLISSIASYCVRHALLF